MKLIPLSKGLFTKVDDEHYDFLMQYKWYAHPKSNGFYARGKVEKELIFMHRVIMGLDAYKRDSRIIDHLDGNPLNNQEHNLRVCTYLENNQNSARRQNSQFPYKGVVCVSPISCGARITVNKIPINLESFPLTEEGIIAAAKCYDKAAKKYFGEFAKLNFP